MTKLIALISVNNTKWKRSRVEIKGNFKMCEYYLDIEIAK